MKRTVGLLLVSLLACAETAYEPDWESDAPLQEGKADGVLDIIPELVIDGASQSGDVGGVRVEFLKLALKRTDLVEISMTVTTGDLNPHLSLYYGTSSYVRSESWNREGDTLTKVYLAESAGTYVAAARAYRGQGEGAYELSVKCLGGPCAGELPPPSSNLDISDVVGCIQSARRCSFTNLPNYNGRVGEARSEVIFQNCLAESTIEDGSTCADACDWVNPDDERDLASELCDSVKESLPFYADQSAECLGALDSCMSECYDAGGFAGFGDEVAYSIEGACWQNGLNGTCDSYARDLEVCGGKIVPGSAGECDALCSSTTGAHIDDLDTLCSSDLGCDEACGIDFRAAAADCGGFAEQGSCVGDFLDETSAWQCEDQHAWYIQNETSLFDCMGVSSLGATTADLSGRVMREVLTTASSTDELTTNQVILASVQMDGIVDVSLRSALRYFDDDEVTVFDVTVSGNDYNWIRGYGGDNEVGSLFEAGTLNLVAEVSDGDLLNCQAL